MSEGKVIDGGKVFDEVIVRFGRQWIDKSKWNVYLLCNEWADVTLREFEDLASAALFADRVAQALGVKAEQEEEKTQ